LPNTKFATLKTPALWPKLPNLMPTNFSHYTIVLRVLVEGISFYTTRQVLKAITFARISIHVPEVVSEVS